LTKGHPIRLLNCGFHHNLSWRMVIKHKKLIVKSLNSFLDNDHQLSEPACQSVPRLEQINIPCQRISLESLFDHRFMLHYLLSRILHHYSESNHRCPFPSCNHTGPYPRIQLLPWLQGSLRSYYRTRKAWPRRTRCWTGLSWTISLLNSTVIVFPVLSVRVKVWFVVVRLETSPSTFTKISAASIVLFA
jgi:hypothetical protein